MNTWWYTTKRLQRPLLEIVEKLQRYEMSDMEKNCTWTTLDTHKQAQKKTKSPIVLVD